MKKYNLKRFLASLLAVLMLASVTGVSPAVFADSYEAPVLQNGEAVIANADVTKQVLAKTLISNYDKCDPDTRDNLDWQYYCKSEYNKADKGYKDDWVSINGQNNKKYGSGLSTRYYDFKSLFDNSYGTYQVRIGSGKAVTFTKLEPQTLTYTLNENVSVVMPYTDATTVDYAKLEQLVLDAAIKESNYKLTRSNTKITYYATTTVVVTHNAWVPLEGGKDVWDYPAVSEGTQQVKLSFKGEGAYSAKDIQLNVTFTGRQDVQYTVNETPVVGLKYSDATTIDYTNIEQDVFNAIITESNPTLSAKDVTITYFVEAESGIVKVWAPLTGAKINSLTYPSVGLGTYDVKIAYAGDSQHNGFEYIANGVQFVSSRDDSNITLNADQTVKIPYIDASTIDFDTLAQRIFDKVVASTTPDLTLSDVTLQYHAKKTTIAGQEATAWVSIKGGRDVIDYPAISEGVQEIRFSYAGNAQYNPTSAQIEVTFLGREASVISFKEKPTVKIQYNDDLSIKLPELKAAIWENVVDSTTPADLSTANVSIKYYASPKTGSVTETDKNWVPLNGGEAPVLGVPITYPAISEGTWKLRFEFAGNADYKGFSEDVEVKFTGRDPAFELKDNVEGMEIGLVFKSATEYDYDATAAAIREALVTKLGTIDLSDVKVQYKSAGQAVDLNYKPSTPVGTAFGEGEFTIVLTWGGDKGTAQYKPFSEEVTVKMVDNRIPSVVALVDVANITYNMDASKMIEEIIKNAIDSANSTLPADYKASDFTVKYYNADEDKWLPIEGGKLEFIGIGLKDYPHINAGDGQQIQVTFNGSKDYKPSDTAEGTLNVAKADVKVSMKLLTSVLAGQKVNKDVLKVTLDPNDPELDLYIVFVGFNTYKEKTIYVKLTEDQEKVIDTISDAQKGFPLYYKEEQTIRGKLNEGMTVDEFITYVDELMKNDTIKSALEKNGIDAEMLQNIVTALKSINKVTGDLRIAIGSPKHAGLYQAFAVAVNKNYNTGVGTGTVIVAMNAAGMKLEPNTELKKQTITVSEAEKYKNGEKAVATLTCDGNASDIDQSCIHYRFTGLSKIYSSHDFPTAPGKYIVTVSVRGGDYYALPTTFTFTVKAD